MSNNNQVILPLADVYRKSTETHTLRNVIYANIQVIYCDFWQLQQQVFM